MSPQYLFLSRNSSKNESRTYSWIRIHGQLDGHCSTSTTTSADIPRPTDSYPNMCHTTSIRLAGQIWGTVRRTYFKTHSDTKISSNRTTITLPSMLSRILPPSPSYPSFSVTLSHFLDFFISYSSFLLPSILSRILPPSPSHFLDFFLSYSSFL